MTVTYLPNADTTPTKTPALSAGKIQTLASILSDGVCTKLKKAEQIGHTGTAAMMVELIRGDLDTIARIDSELAVWLARVKRKEQLWDRAQWAVLWVGMAGAIAFIVWLLARSIR